MTLEDRVRRHRLAILQRAALLGNVTQACRETGISRTLFYRWRRRYVRYGADGLRPRPTRPSRWPRQAIPVLEYQVLAYALPWPTHGPARIAIQLRQPLWGGWRISASGVYGILTRHGLQTRWERLTRLEPGGDGRAADGADRSIAQLEQDLQAYLRFYNRDRSHQGYRLHGRTPASVFLARKAS
jgi:hypothetical protein